MKDGGNKIANISGAQVTPEVFLLDSDSVIRYHGAIGNSEQPTNQASKANGEDLEQALDVLLAGREIPIKTTKTFGCIIRRLPW